MIADCEARLLKSIKDLRFGSLYPDEMVVRKQVACGDLSPAEQKLLEKCDEFGTPLEVKVSDGRPVYAIFEVTTPAGRGHKRIEL